MNDTSASETDESGINRRRVLKSAASASAIIGMGGYASAKREGHFTAAEAEAATEEYRDLETLKAALGEETDLLEAVSETGYIEGASVDALGIETLGEPASASDSTVFVDAHSINGEVTADIRVVREFDDGRLVISVQPDVNSMFAIFDREGADEYEEVYTSDACGGCADNEECTATCAICGSETCTGCNGDRTMKVVYGCECVENCSSW